MAFEAYDPEDFYDELFLDSGEAAFSLCWI